MITTPLLHPGTIVENPISNGGKWAANAMFGTAHLACDGSAIATEPTQFSGSAYVAGSTPMDTEISVQIGTNANIGVNLYSRILFPESSSVSYGYLMAFNRQFGTWTFGRNDGSNSFTQQTTGNWTWNTSDIVTYRAIGYNHYLYANTTLVALWKDTVYLSPGNFGVLTTAASGTDSIKSIYGGSALRNPQSVYSSGMAVTSGAAQ